MDFSDVHLAVLFGTTIGFAALSVALGALLLSRHSSYLAARESENNFRELYNNISEGVFRSTLDGHMISANPALVRLNGFASEAEMLNEVNDIAGQWYVEPGRRAELHAILVEHGRVQNFVSRSTATRRASASGSRKARAWPATRGPARRATTTASCAR